MDRNENVHRTLKDLALRRWDRVSQADIEALDAYVRALEAAPEVLREQLASRIMRTAREDAATGLDPTTPEPTAEHYSSRANGLSAAAHLVRTYRTEDQ